jgi:predicted RNA-binding protein with PIN domain
MFVKQNREHVAFEYKQALSNFYQLRKEAWKHFNSTESETVKTNLYSVIADINTSIQNMLSVGDMIAQEVIAESGAVAEEARQALEELDKLEQQEEAATEAIEKEQEEQGAASPNEE